MQISKPIIAGIDVSKASVTVCCLSELPDNPKNWIRKNRPKKLLLNDEGREALLKLRFDYAVMEPTGVYSRVWRHWIREAGRSYRLVGHAPLANYRKSWAISSKTDNLDSFALAMYGVEKGGYPEAWLQEKEFTLSDLVNHHAHLNRQKNGVQNYLRQMLNWQCPESYTANFWRKWGQLSVPKRLRVLCDPAVGGKWRELVEQTSGVGLTESAVTQASLLVSFEEAEIQTEQRIIAELEDPKYEPYKRACSAVGFSDWMTAAAIAQAYPFERFLKLDGTRNYIHTFTGSGARVRKDQSLRAFKLSLGLGQVQISSGDWNGWVAGGSKATRNALFIYIRSQYMQQCILRKRGSDYDKEVTDTIKHQYDKKGILKIARKRTESFYKALCAEFGA